ncbi:MAG: PQQ-binding-like beta-propeller repeat protein, partial [Pirellulales bacterium]|nr:PQQ-binding-like beta-propeller repeat protein [Pirellulales bacterium]
MLSAYDLADGSLRWRLPAGDAAAAPKDEGGFPRLADDVPAKPWYLGPPLVSRGDLYLLVEQRGEVRLEVRRAADAKLRWSQPLASYDPPEMISLEASWPRRLAGLTPAVTEGLLVCPVGGGCVVAVDLPLRSLRWATAYPRPDAEARINRGGGLQVARDLAPPRSEPCPIIADGRVFLAPHDAEVVFCLSLQNGTPIWSRPRERLMTVAGEVDGRLILVADDGVEAVDAATGRRLWRRPLGEGEQPSGRGILTPERIFVPCDAPGILEIAVRDGRVIARRAMRGGSLPGNLVVHRGEVISQGVDSLDVFHQEATLDSRIETALDTDPADPWAAYWRSQAAIEAGAVDEGLEGLAAAVGPGGFRVSRGTLAATLIRAMQQDFQAASAWLDRFDGAGRSKDLARVAVDGYLRAGNPARAWVFLEPLLALSPGDSSEKEPAILVDPLEPDIRIGADRWVRSRLARVSQAADEPLRQKIADRCGAIVADVLEAADPEARQRLSIMVERLGHQPAAAAARTAIVADTVGATKHWAVRGQLLALETAAPAVAAAGMLSDSKAWPLGRVNHRLHRA